ncbi:MAG: ABC transporter ATP-binding protein [Acidimicrobiia bacterium]
MTKQYGTRPAVDDLSFVVDAGAVFALLGPNGAGKTTTVETLEGYRSPDAGTVRVLGLDPVEEGPALKQRMGLMLQSGGIYNGARVDEIVQLFCSFYDRAADPDELISLVDLEDSRRVTFRRLSGGQQRRLALAVALAGTPDVVFLDEPTAGMDPRARQTTYQIVRDLRARGVTVLLTTHLLDEAEALADSVGILDKGRLVALGSPSELMASHGGIRFGALAGLGLDDVPAQLGHVVEVRAGQYLAEVEATPERVAALAAWAASRNVLLGYVRSGSRSLEDLFLELVE